MSKKQINIVWLFVLAFFVAEIILILIGTSNFQAKRNHILEDRTNQLRTSYRAIFNTYYLTSHVIFEQIINTQEVNKLFSRAYKSDKERQSEIRDSLFQLLNPIYIKLSSQAIKQLHFHLPDNRSFLRFHSPEKFGDDLSDVRESVRIANTEKRFVQGFEEGRIYNGFRFVYPMSYKGEHIGTVETSISFGAINHMLYKQADNVYSFVIRKAVVDEKVFKDKRSNYIVSTISDNWVEEKKFLHYDDAGEHFPKETLEELDKVIKKKYQSKLNDGKPFSVFIDLDKKKFTVSFIPINNIKKEHVAYLMSYVLDYYTDVYIGSVATFIGGGTFLLLIITILFYIIYTKSRTIGEQHDALIQTESRYQHIYNTVDIGILSNKLNGDILMANPKMIDMLGCQNLKELKTHNIKDFYIDPNLQKNMIVELIEEKSNLIIHDLFWKRKDGKRIVVKFGGKIHTTAKGEQFIESVVQDITEMRALEDSLKISEVSLRESNAAKDRFFTILAHDLRGPFNSLLGLTEIIALQPETVDDNRKERFIQLIYTSLKNISNLIENLLEWSQSQQGTISFNPKEIKLEPLIQETVDLLSEGGFLKQITIRVNIDKSTKLLADENMVKTIVRNLISNAIKFTHKEGLIKIYVGKPVSNEGRNFTEIIIEDNGVGITKNDLSKLFKIDSGFSNLGTENEKGTGLGLVLVKEFVKKHDGTIVVESERGIGTKVIFTLPTRS